MKKLSKIPYLFFPPEESRGAGEGHDKFHFYGRQICQAREVYYL